MKMTVGPLPPAVYWRRRAAVGSVLIAILLGFATCQAGGSDPTPAASRSTPSPAPTRNAAVAPSPSASGSPAPAQAQAPAAGGGSTSQDAPAPQNAPAAGAVPDCTDTDLRLVGSLERGTVAYGSMPKLQLTISNTRSAACRRDVGANAQELRVMDGTRRLWSSDDCQPLRGTSVRTLQPGEKRVYTVTWSGKDSTPGCKDARSRVAPGTYRLIARLDTLVSEPVTFRIS
jgi:hypothetical protein